MTLLCSFTTRLTMGVPAFLISSAIETGEPYRLTPNAGKGGGCSDWQGNVLEETITIATRMSCERLSRLLHWKSTSRNRKEKKPNTDEVALPYQSNCSV